MTPLSINPGGWSLLNALLPGETAGKLAQGGCQPRQGVITTRGLFRLSQSGVMPPHSMTGCRGRRPAGLRKGDVNPGKA